MQTVQVPKIGVEDGVVVIQQWAKPNGALVHKDEVLAMLETDKVTVDLPSPGDGILEVVEFEGSQVRMTDVIALLHDPNETMNPAPPSNARPYRASPAVKRLAASLGVSLADLAESGPRKARITRKDVLEATEGLTAKTVSSIVPASPLARRLAQQWGIDLQTVSGQGPGHAVLAEDVRRASALRQPSPDDNRPHSNDGGRLIHSQVPLTPIRQAIARNMKTSLAETAQMTLMGWFDVYPLWNLFQSIAKDREYLGIKASWTAIFVRALGVALSADPTLNSAIVEQDWILWESIHVGVAVATERGLVVPVIRDANRKTLMDIHREVVLMANKARENRLGAEDMHGATFTLSNFGSFGGEWGTPILNRGESGLLGIGGLEKVPVVDAMDQIVIGYRMPYSLTVDHQIVDGAAAGSFVNTLKKIIERPVRLL